MTNPLHLICDFAVGFEWRKSGGAIVYPPDFTSQEEKIDGRYLGYMNRMGYTNDDDNDDD